MTGGLIMTDDIEFFKTIPRTAELLLEKRGWSIDTLVDNSDISRSELESFLTGDFDHVDATILTRLSEGLKVNTDILWLLTQSILDEDKLTQSFLLTFIDHSIDEQNRIVKLISEYSKKHLEEDSIHLKLK